MNTVRRLILPFVWVAWLLAVVLLLEIVGVLP